MIKQGAGTQTFSGTSSYTGGTTINAGILSVYGSIVGDVTLSSDTTLDVANSFTIGNLISSPANSFVTLESGKTLTLGTGASVDFAGQISGAGGLIKQGNGTQGLSGTNSYTGGTVIDAGFLSVFGSIAGDVSIAGGATLDVANSFTIGNLIGTAANSQVTLAAGTTLTFGTGSNVAFPGQISGLGGLVKQGADTQIFSGANSYTGGTAISAGVLSVSGSITGNVSIAANATFDVANNLNIGNLIGAAANSFVTLESGTTLTLGSATSSAFAGKISGAGSLVKQLNGTLTLSGVNTYTGSTSIDGGSLQIGTSASFPLGGTLAIASGSTFDISPFATGLTIGDLTGAGFVTLGSNTLTFGTSNSLAFSGSISGTGGALIKAGSGAVALSGTNTYTAGTTLASGTLQIASPANIGSGVLIASGGTLELLSGFGTNTIANPLRMSGNGVILSDLIAADTATFSGNINAAPGGLLTVQQIAGSGFTLSGSISGANSLLMNGSGTLTLSGANTYSGTTTIARGTVQINAAGALPSSSNVVDNGLLLFNTAATTTYSGNISGSGALSVENGSTLVLSGTNTYTGGTSIDSLSTLQIQSPQALFSSGNVLKNGDLVFNYSTPGIGSVSGVISGNGDLIMNGTGVLQLSNPNNSYSGPTQLNAGTIQVLASGALGTGSIIFNGGTLEISAPFLTLQPVTTNTTGTIEVDLGEFAIFGSAVSGAGNLVTAGPGSLFLSGVNTYTGPTTVESGALILPLGASINNSSMIQVQSATLLVNGTALSPLSVSAGGALLGSGTLGAATIDGIVNPGNDTISTLNGAQFILNSSSSYNVAINNTTSDQIAATTSVEINGGQLQVVPLGLTNGSVASYTVITSPLVTVTTPFTLVNPLTRYPFSLVYEPTDVRLVLTGPPIPFHVIVNVAGATCFDLLVEQDLPDLAEIISILDLQSASQIAHSIEQMQPQNFNNIAFAQENTAEAIRQIYTNHFFEQRAIPCQEGSNWRLWAAPFLDSARQHGKASLPGYSQHFAGFSTALDYRIQKHWMVTGGFSFASTTMHVPTARTKADFKTYAGSLGAGWTDNHAFADALFSYLYSPISAKRTMQFSVSTDALAATVTRTARHTQGSDQLLGHLGGGYDFKFKTSASNVFHLYPFANLDYLYLFEKPYRESGAGSLDLYVQSKSDDLLRPEVGIGMGYKGCFNKIQALFDISVSYVGQFRFLGKNTKASFAPVDCTFSAKGLQPQNNLISPSPACG